jgi:3-oxoadipate enol-lactonase
LPASTAASAAGGAEADDPVIQGFHDSFGDVNAITRGIRDISLDPSRTTDVVRTMSTAVSEQLWRSWFGAGAYTSMRENLPGIAVPACYVIGGKDAIAPEDKLLADVRAMPGGRLVLLSDAGYLAPYECPEPVADEIHAFIDGR